MPPIATLANQIMQDFPGYTFFLSEVFRWSPKERLIFYPHLHSEADLWSLLHEIAHGELGHTTYELDIELVAHESHAWAHAAQVLAPKYNLTVPEDYAQDHLDTYRYWLHQRSTCPSCGQNGVQTKNTYRCINCRCIWRANEARLCALRRITLQDQSQL